MGIKIRLTEEEIIDKPNDAELGSYVRKKYVVQRELMKQEIDTLSLGQIPDDTPEKCLLCGKLSPYTFSTHVDLRTGYIPGAGQGCFEPEKCLKKNK